MATSPPSSCSHWWHCPIYFAMAVTLAAIAISTATSSSSSSKPRTSATATPPFSTTNASLSLLRTRGFTSIAALLRIYPEHFLSSSGHSTIFAFQDSTISEINSHPQFLKQLLKYHTVPLSLPFSELSKMPPGTCLSTLIKGKRIVITKSGIQIEINNVSISHPNLFLDGKITIHGVIGAFTRPIGENWEINQQTLCENSGNGPISRAREIKNVVRFLSSNGYVSFAVGLSSVLEAVFRDFPYMVSGTIFAPAKFGFVSSSKGLLYRTVRYHIVPDQRLNYTDLASLPDKSSLKTLVTDKNVVISNTSVGSEHRLGVNGVEIMVPNAFLSENFIIHGISEALKIEELPRTWL